MKITFKDFDMNEVTDHFDFMDPKQWRKVDKFVVLSSDDLDTGRVVKKMGFSQDEDFDSFYHGGRYALSLVNKALKAAKSGLEIRETDLGEGSGFVLVQADDTEESFAQRVFK
jgi:hypothetical protein